MVETTVQELYDSSQNEVRVDWIKLCSEGDVSQSVDLKEAGSERDQMALSLLSFTGTIEKADEEYTEAQRNQKVSIRRTNRGTLLKACEHKPNWKD
jgi:hypothetical protein